MNDGSGIILLFVSIIFLATPALVLVINTIAFLVKEPVKKIESETQLIEPHYTSKQLFGYISGFMLPANYLISFLTAVAWDGLGPAGVGFQPGDYVPFSAGMFYGFLVFAALIILGALLGIIGFIIVPPEESTRRYKIISWVGLFSNGLPVILTVVGIMLLKSQ